MHILVQLWITARDQERTKSFRNIHFNLTTMGHCILAAASPNHTVLAFLKVPVLSYQRSQQNCSEAAMHYWAVHLLRGVMPKHRADQESLTPSPGLTWLHSLCSSFMSGLYSNLHLHFLIFSPQQFHLLFFSSDHFTPRLLLSHYSPRPFFCDLPPLLFPSPSLSPLSPHLPLLSRQQWLWLVSIMHNHE